MAGLYENWLQCPVLMAVRLVYVLKEENEEAPPKTSVKTILIIYSFT
jgi:hypothetical protein